ncbi:adenylate/guanylate cyclase domain-containing protein [Miniimonas sp. S16]|uniref:adenylate/guanylate cyclase domain-containing protein n=1 Tax=Miniimonas sp. S16 TaxID=2171623 RepID=UPI000D5264C6|nr:adenylate/guanylate cyclase domain-containing protein [Miniimonas sp. S16]
MDDVNGLPGSVDAGTDGPGAGAGDAPGSAAEDAVSPAVAQDAVEAAVAQDAVEASDEGRRTLERQTLALLGELPRLDAYDVARLVGTSAARVLQFWRALGFAGEPASSRVFTHADADALRSALTLLEKAELSEGAFRTLIRAAAHSADRLSLWQVEALVEDAERRYVLDNVSARLVVLDTIDQTIDALVALQSHAWRRHLLALLTRTERSVGRAGMADLGDELPLERAIGFIDVVSYTQRTAHLGAAELSALVQEFDGRARDVVTELGARVVKTLGDGVMFVSDDLGTCLAVAFALRDTFREGAVPIQVHGALTWGRVLSRSGDVYGPSVNLAARLADLAHAGQLLTDEVTWAVAEHEPDIEGFVAEALPPAQVHGIGAVSPYLLRRTGEPGGAPDVE